MGGQTLKSCPGVAPAMARPPTPPVEDLDAGSLASTARLVAAMGPMGGFTAKAVSDAAALLRRMTRDCAVVLLSIPAAPLATGLRGVVVELVRRGLVHGIITTSGTLDHDLARTWGAYHQGSFDLDDEKLLKQGVHRLGSVLVPRASYGELLEERLKGPLEDLFAATPSISTKDFCRWLGQLLEKDARRDSSLLYACYKHGVPVFVPGPTDGAVGSQVWLRYQHNRKIRFDLLADEQALYDLVNGAKKLGGVLLGGGISKHHLIWWAQFRDGLDYAVAVTTAHESDGSLSGARTKEAISWGKLKAGADHVTVEGDVTLVLPLLAASWLEEGSKAKGKS